MIASRDTAERYGQHRIGTHNAVVSAETSALTGGTATDYVSASPDGTGERVQKWVQRAELAGPGEGQRSSAVEHPTHNGKVAGAAPAAGIAGEVPTCAKCGARRWLKKPAKHPECYPCRGRVMRMTNRTKTPNRPRPNGDRWVDRKGYVRVRVGYGQPAAYEHRVVMAQVLGRELLPTEDVHHINENKQDNRPENLEVVSRSVHTAHHNRIAPKRRKQGRAA